MSFVIGVEQGFAASIPLSANISNAYFLWLICIPCFDLVTSNPRKKTKKPEIFDLELSI